MNRLFVANIFLVSLAAGFWGYLLSWMIKTHASKLYIEPHNPALQVDFFLIILHNSSQNMTQQLHKSHVFFQTNCLCVTLVSIRICLNMSPWLVTIYDSLSLGNVFLFLLLLFLLHYLMVLYEFRNMPPGPRLTTLPVFGNIFSLDHKAKRFPDTFRRSVLNFQSSLLINMWVALTRLEWTVRFGHAKMSTENRACKNTIMLF